MRKLKGRTAKNTVIAIENAIKKLRMSEEEACSFMDTTIEQYRGYKKRINKA